MAGRKSSRCLVWATLILLGIQLNLWAVSLSANRSSAQELNQDISEVTPGEWMHQWMGGTKAVGGSLNLRRFKDPVYLLLDKISWQPNPGETPFPPVTVPKGFVTDLASIPQIFFSLLRPDGEYAYPAIIHDYLYWDQPISREEADEIFKLAMQDFEVNAAVKWLIHQTVRWGGEFAWDNNAEAKARGERRILKRFPQDPTMTWKEWKERPGVFAD